MAEIEEIRPQPRQEMFLSSPADIAIFGGANFGGKTWSLLLEPLRHAGNRKFGAVCFRRTYPEIREEGGLWDESRKIYGNLPFPATERESRLQWVFRSGARVSFRHCQRETDLKKYDGAQFALLMFDQLEHFTEGQFFFLLSRNRTDCGIRAYCRATCNPDPDSWLASFVSWWIDDDGYPIEERTGEIRWFVRRDNVIEWADDPSEFEEHENPKSATFVYSLPEDNPIGMELNPGYVADLEALPRYLALRRRWGNWKARPEAGKIVDQDWLVVEDEQAFDFGGADACLYFDFAATEKEMVRGKKANDPDETASVLILRLRDGRYLVAYCYSAPLGPADVDTQFVGQAFQFAAWCRVRNVENYRVRWEREPGSASVREANRYVKMLAGLDAEAVPSRGDKLQRARPFIVQARARNVWVLRGDWNDRYRNHLHNYPELTHDDIWDANSGAFNGVTRAEDAVSARARQEIVEPTPGRWSGAGTGKMPKPRVAWAGEGKSRWRR